MPKKILVVDDEPEIVKLIAMRLKAHGYDIIAANDGVSATMKATRERPDLIVMDIKMPAGDGLSVCEHLKHSVDTMLIPIIFITAHPNDEVKQRSQQLGAEAYVVKPIDMNDLLGKISHILGEPAPNEPLKAAQQAPTEPNPQASTVASKKVLIVDDEPDIVKMLTLRLEANNFTVISAGDGHDGLQKAKKEKPDVIILDLMLPKMDGYQVCRMLKFDEKYRHIPIIMLTARSLKSDEELGRETGADIYINKPFKAESIVTHIKTLLNI